MSASATPRSTVAEVIRSSYFSGSSDPNESRRADRIGQDVPMNFSGRVAIVTGGASGMGAATARRLAAAGADVSIVDRNAALADKVAAEIGGTTFAGDVADSAFCDRVV